MRIPSSGIWNSRIHFSTLLSLVFSLTLTNNSYCSSPLSPRTRMLAIRGAKDNRVRSIIWLAMSGSKRVLGDFICNKGRIHEEKRQRQPNNFDEEYRTIKVGRIVAAKGIEEMQSRVPLCMGPQERKTLSNSRPSSSI